MNEGQGEKVDDASSTVVREDQQGSSADKDEEVDDDDDPEYNVHDDPDEPDLEDYRTDRAVQITKKEVNELLEELFDTLQEEEEEEEEVAAEMEEQEEEAPLQTGPKFNVPQALRFEAPLASMLTERRRTVRKQYEALQQRRALQDTTNHHRDNLNLKDSTSPQPDSVTSVLVLPSRVSPALHLDYAQKLQLQQQVQQHVQLLTQVHLLSRRVDALNHEAAITKNYLEELQQFSGRQEEALLPSCFRVCNLQPALDLLQEVEQRDQPPAAPLAPAASRRWLPTMTPTTNSHAFPLMPADAAWLFATRPVFLYTELLPVCSLDRAQHTRHQRSVYTAGEDGLIILGLKHFEGAVQPDQLISSYLLCKTQWNFRKHVREMSSSRAPHSSVIKTFLTQGAVPTLPLACSRVQPGEQRPPVDGRTSIMPNWLKNSQQIIQRTRLSTCPPRYPPSLPQGCTLRLHPYWHNKASRQPAPPSRRLFTLAHNASLLPLCPADRQADVQPISYLAQLPAPGVALPSNPPALPLAPPPPCGAVPLAAVHPVPPRPLCADIIQSCLPIGQRNVSRQQDTGPPLPLLLPLPSIPNPETTNPIMPCSAAVLNPGYVVLQMVWTPSSPSSSSSSLHALGQKLHPAIKQEQKEVKNNCTRPHLPEEEKEEEERSLNHLGVVCLKGGEEKERREEGGGGEEEERGAAGGGGEEEERGAAGGGEEEERGATGGGGGEEEERGAAGGGGGGGGEDEERREAGGGGEEDNKGGAGGGREEDTGGGGDGEQGGEGDEEEDEDGEKEKDEDQDRQGEEEEEEDFDDLTQDEDEEEVMSSASEESVLSVPELQETMKQLTWLASERRLCADADSEEDHSPTSPGSQEEEEEEEEEGPKGEESGEGRDIKAGGDEETPSCEGTPRGGGGRCSGRGRGRSRPLRGLRRSRQERHSKDAAKLLLLYDENLLNNDPHRESKDVAFAQSYLNRVREALQDFPGKVEEFVCLLNEFEQLGEGQRVLALFRKLRCILGNRTDLLRDFAAFMLPEQALECGLFEEQQAFERSRRFLRQLEISFGDNPSHYQKIIKALQAGPDLSPTSIHELKVQMATLLKGHTHLQAEFWVFFDELRPPPARPGQFEEAHWPEEGGGGLDGGEGVGSGSGGGASCGFEEVTLPELEEEEEGHKIQPMASRRQRRKLDVHRNYKDCDWSDKDWPCLCHDAKIRRHRRKGCSRCHGNKSSVGVSRAMKSLDPLYAQIDEEERKSSEKEQSPALKRSRREEALQSTSTSSVTPSTSSTSSLTPSTSSVTPSTSSTSSLTPSTSSVTPSTSSTSSLTPSTSSVTPSTSSVTPSTSSTSSVTPSTSSLTPSTSSVTPSTSPIHPSTYSVISSTSPILPSTSSVISSTSSVTPSTSSLNPSTSPIHPSTSSVISSTSPIHPSTSSTSPILPSTSSVTSSTSPILPSTSSVTPSSSSLTSSTSSVTPSTSSVISSGSSLTSSTSSLTPSTSSLISSTSTLTPSTSLSTCPSVTSSSSTSSTSLSTCASSASSTSSTSPSSAPPRPSPPSDLPVCAKNISLTASGEKVILWTREADRVILTTCQQEGANQNTFQAISSLLGNKTPSEVSRRFRDLMRLFRTAARQTSSEDEAPPADPAANEERD
ncbi:LOW QUALITY PROTEIN: GON-4-like protein [Scomber scombrus]|uniref:LOW QUALITY PROTEIN: GON-4-like protein n=1 Tax=Scomber scombrus TaxID=13677 RepID=A0AAV1Q4X9_SCOSC